MATKLDIVFYQGDDERLIFEAPDDLSGAWVWFTAKSASDVAADDSQAVLRKVYDPSGATTDGIALVAGQTYMANIDFGSAQTRSMEVGQLYRYDVQTHENGKTRTHFYGNLKVQVAEVTLAGV